MAEWLYCREQERIVIKIATRRLKIVLLLVTILVTAPSHASVCRVTTAGTDNGDGSDWNGQAMHLHTALGDSGCEQIWVAGGVYKPVTPVDPSAVTRAEREVSFRIDRALAVYGGFDGTETFLEQRDPDTHLTVLSGDIDGNDASDENGITQNAADISGANSFHVLWIDGGSVSGGVTQTTRIDGLIVSGGLADDSSPWNPDGRGGGLYCDGEGGECSPVLSHMVFVGNRAYYSGGAIYNRGVNGISSPILERARLAGNDAGQIGGAIHNDARDGASHPQLADIDFSNNHAGVAGGAVFNFGMYGSSSPQLDGATFYGNVALEAGGAIASHGLVGETAVQLTNITFHANTAPDGGAMFNHGRSDGSASPLLRNVTFNGNSADHAGGAIHNHASPGTLIQGDDGEQRLDAGISTPSLVNVILWGNNAVAIAPELFNDGATPTLRYSIVAGGCPADSDCSGGDIIEDDPMLGPLQDNGGFTRTQFIDPDGSALEAGSDADCAATDQRGVPRPQGNGCDIGAWELIQPASLTVVVSGQGLVNAGLAPVPIDGGIVDCDEAGDGQANCAAIYDDDDNQNVTLSLAAAEGWNIDSVTGCDGNLSGNTYTIAELAVNCSVNVDFAINTYSVTAAVASGEGSISPTSQSVIHGDTASFTVTPTHNWSIDSVTGCDGSLDDNTYTTGPVTGDCQVSASFMHDGFTITIDITPSGAGSASCTPNPVPPGGSAICTASPTPSHAFIGWAGACDGMSCELTHVNEPLSITALFEIIDELFDDRFEPAP